MLVNKIIRKALGLRNGFALFLFAYHFGHSFEIYGERFTLCFTGPANLLGGFVFMVYVVIVLFFFYFTISKERRGAGKGAVTMYPFHLWKLLTHLTRTILFWGKHVICLAINYLEGCFCPFLWIV